MARFYRLQREGRQLAARELYATMCVLDDHETITSQIAVGVLMRACPERPAGPTGMSWPASRRKVRYAELAAAAEARGAHFDAWMLLGKALESASDIASPQAIAAQHRRRAMCAVASGMAAAALVDCLAAIQLGDWTANLLHVQALQTLGCGSEALEFAEQALKALNQTTSADVASAARDLQALVDRLRHAEALGDNADTGASMGSAAGKRLPTVPELQQYAARAVRPDSKDSRLYRAVLAVTMSWWQELEGDDMRLANALGRAAIAARGELAAVDASVRPEPMKQIFELWEKHEDELKQTGALAGDMQYVPGLFPGLARACQGALGERESITVPGCDAEGHDLRMAWQLCCALAAEVRRAFRISNLQVATELRIYRPRSSDQPRGPEVDNGGLLPDNRREVSFWFYIPADGKEPGAPATLMLRTKDGEKTLSFNLRAGRLFVWWSRQTFHQVLGGAAYFAVACWGVVAQAADGPGH